MESEQLVLVSLRGMGCSIPNEIEAIRELSPADIVRISSQCVALIDPSGQNVPPSLPRNIAARHRLCTSLGQRIQELGYSGECGYNQFLYPNERDLKHLLLWFLTRVPRTDNESERAALSSGALLQSNVMKRLKSWSKETWTPPFCYLGRGRGHALRTFALQVPADQSSRSAPSVSQQVAIPSQELGPSLMERNTQMVAEAAERELAWNAAAVGGMEERRRQQAAAAAELIRGAFSQEDSAVLSRALGTSRGNGEGTGDGDSLLGPTSLNDLLASYTEGAGDGADGDDSAFAHQTEFAQEQAAPTAEAAAIAAQAESDREAEAEQLRLDREAELEALEQELRKAEADAANFAKEKERLTQGARQYTAELNAELQRKKKLESEYKVKQATLKMLPDAEANIKKLKEICQRSANRLVELAEEWEEYRVPLIQELRDLRRGMVRRKTECQWKVGEIRTMREQMRTMATEIREAEERHRLLAAELERMPKDLNRAVYTYRIMDIIKQVKKQEGEIAKIIADIRVVQKETNTVVGRLGRTENITDDHVYAAAKNSRGDPNYVKTYKLLTLIRQYFDDMIEATEEMGKLQNNKRDMDSRAQQLMTRNTALNMERIRSDLQQVKDENKALRRKIKKASS